jgi:hypothetical protein
MIKNLQEEERAAFCFMLSSDIDQRCNMKFVLECVLFK